MKQYSTKYDAYYDSDTKEWLDSLCEDPECIYCKYRPEENESKIN